MKSNKSKPVKQNEFPDIKNKHSPRSGFYFVTKKEAYDALASDIKKIVNQASDFNKIACVAEQNKDFNYLKSVLKVNDIPYIENDEAYLAVTGTMYISRCLFRIIMWQAGENIRKAPEKSINIIAKKCGIEPDRIEQIISEVHNHGWSEFKVPKDHKSYKNIKKINESK